MIYRSTCTACRVGNFQINLFKKKKGETKPYTHLERYFYKIAVGDVCNTAKTNFNNCYKSDIYDAFI